MSTAPTIANSAAAIFSRVIRLEETELSPEASQAILQFAFALPDRERMHELARKNQAGALTPAEDEELNNYLCVGNLLGLLQSKARRSLRQAEPGRALFP